MSKQQNFTVAVFPLAYPGYVTRYIAYLRDYEPSWHGYCPHIISAVSGKEAKKLAMREHKRNCVAQEVTR